MEIIKRNWKLKLTSLIIAIFFWSFVIVSENPVVTTKINNVQIVYENIDSLENRDLIINDALKEVTEVSVSGQRNNIINITPQHIRATANFNGLDEGTHTVRLSYSLPDGIKLSNAPETITVNIEKVISRDFAVNIVNVGAMPENYILEMTKPSPEKISIKGARSKLDSIEKVVANLNLENLKTNTVTTEEVKPLDANGNIVTGLNFVDFVSVNAEITKQKEVSIVPIIVGEIGENFKINSNNLSRSVVLVKGPESIIDKLQTVSTQEIDVTNINSSREVPVKLDLPADIKLVNEETTVLMDFVISEKVSKELTFVKTDIEIQSDTSSTFTISESESKVKLFGFQEELDKITNSTAKLKMDLRNRIKGTYSIVPKLFIGDIEVDSKLIENITPLRVTIIE